MLYCYLFSNMIYCMLVLLLCYGDVDLLLYVVVIVVNYRLIND